MLQASRGSRRPRMRGTGLFVCMALACAVSLLGSPAASASDELDHISQTIRFEQPLLQEIQVNGSTFTSVAIPGTWTQGLEVGQPALPVHFVQILLPPGKDVSNVSISGKIGNLTASGVDLTAAPVFPQQKPVPFGFPQPVELTVDEEIYSSTRAYPGVDFVNPKTGYCRGYGIFSVGLYPVHYIPSKGALVFYSEMTITVDLTDSGSVNPYFRQLPSDLQRIASFVSNPEMLQAYRKASPPRAEYPGGICDPADDYDYVIITTTTNSLHSWTAGGPTPYNWESLMQRHAFDDGLACTLVTVQDILAETDYTSTDPLFNDTPARVREFCRDAYQDWGVEYVFVGADAELIPARLMSYSYESNVDADIYWSNLDNTFNADHDTSWGEEGDSGFDLYGEIHIGRLTCDIPQDVSNWLTKLFYYMNSQERDYLDNAAFYGGDTGWDCQGDDFIDFSAIKETSGWLGPDPNDIPYPSDLGTQYGFESWNNENPSVQFDLTVKWTAEPPNAGGWMGGSSSAAITGLRNAISADTCTIIAGIAHANEYMSLDVGNTEWESSYHNTKPFFIHDYGCHCGDMNAADDGILHSMLFHSNIELAFGCVYNTGYGWGELYCTGSSSAVQQKAFFDYLFDVANNSGHVDNWQVGKAMSFSKDVMAPHIDFDSYGTWRGIIQSCLLFSDPALKLRPPGEPILFLSFPEGLPEGPLPPGPETTIRVKIEDGLQTYVPGSGLLHYRFDPLDAYSVVPLSPLPGNLYEAAIPNTEPGDAPQYYISAEGDLGATVCAPYDAPSTVYSFDVYLIEEMWHDNFETDTGWTVQSENLTAGAWQRCDPNTTSGDQVAPVDDNPAGEGTLCYVTGNGPVGGTYSDYDVDGGPTRLISPTIDLSSGDATISAYCWFYSRDGGSGSLFSIDVSNNNGTTWTNVYLTHSSLSGWAKLSFDVADWVTPTAQVKVRFNAQDQPNSDIVEAGVDDFDVERHNEFPSVWAQAYGFSAGDGCDVTVCLDAGSANGGRQYKLLASFSGSSPGTTVPGGLVLPLNRDSLTNFILDHPTSPKFQGYNGTLGGQGRATAHLVLPAGVASAHVGKTMTHAFLLLKPCNFVSNPIFIEILP